MIKKLVVPLVAACVFGACAGDVTHAAINRGRSNETASSSVAQQADGDRPSGASAESARGPGDSPVTPEVALAGDRYLSSKEFALAVLVTVMLLFSLLLQFALLRKIQGLKAEDALRTFGLTFVIAGTAFFIVAGFDSEQIAPAIGLFGTIAGYMLGKSDRRVNGRHE